VRKGLPIHEKQDLPPFVEQKSFSVENPYQGIFFFINKLRFAGLNVNFGLNKPLYLKQDRIITVLMADDDPDDQYLVKKAIEESDISHSFTALDNGLQLMDLLLCRGSFARAAGPLPDCILLDLNMPLLDGFETLSLLKADQALRHIPVYILSTTRSDDDKAKAMRMGANGFYIKPARFAELKDIVSDIFVKSMPLVA
jgi:CheY-like chemotaxis protein